MGECFEYTLTSLDQSNSRDDSYRRGLVLAICHVNSDCNDGVFAIRIYHKAVHKSSRIIRHWERTSKYVIRYFECRLRKGSLRIH